jgi:hypothetical protein
MFFCCCKCHKKACFLISVNYLGFIDIIFREGRLNIAEIELAALAVQCLGYRRIGGIEVLNLELSTWYRQRNQTQKGVDWQFTTKDARIKLKKLYPTTI